MLSIILLALSLLIAIFGIMINDQFFKIAGGILIILTALYFLITGDNIFLANNIFDQAINLSLLIIGLYITVDAIVRTRSLKIKKKLDEDENYDEY